MTTADFSPDQRRVDITIRDFPNSRIGKMDAVELYKTLRNTPVTPIALIGEDLDKSSKRGKKLVSKFFTLTCLSPSKNEEEIEFGHCEITLLASENTKIDAAAGTARYLVVDQTTAPSFHRAFTSNKVENVVYLDTSGGFRSSVVLGSTYRSFAFTYFGSP